jgi:hypothetical protein
MRRERTHTLTRREAARDADVRTCDWPGCQAEGGHRAPKSRDRLNDYHWFCLEHVRAYNAGWNYYAGMSDAEVEADTRRDTVWHRPTWPIGTPPGGADMDPGAFGDPFGLFGEGGPGRASGRGEESARHQSGDGLAGPHRAALAVFGLEIPVTRDEIRRRYKQLVKRHHPDTNGGDKAAEEKLKEINDAYQTLIAFVAP